VALPVGRFHFKALSLLAILALKPAKLMQVGRSFTFTAAGQRGVARYRAAPSSLASIRCMKCGYLIPLFPFRSQVFSHAGSGTHSEQYRHGGNLRALADCPAGPRTSC